MEELKILENNEVIINNTVKNLKEKLKKQTSVVYFCDEIEKNEILKICNIENVKNLVIVSKYYNHVKNKKISSTRNFKKIKNAAENIVIILNINDNYEYMKFMVRNAQKVVNMCKNSNKSIQIVEIQNKKSKYFEETKNCVKAMFIDDDYERYSFIYDTMCDVLDAEFSKHNYCQFKNDSCIYNKSPKSTHKTMGCCYSFEYNSIFNIKPIRNIKHCALYQDNHCTAKNLSCKLFTCRILKKNNIVFNMHDYLLLECFLDRRQKDVLDVAYFVKREDILEKLMEVKNDKGSYFMYIMRFKYRIDKRY